VYIRLRKQTSIGASADLRGGFLEVEVPGGRGEGLGASTRRQGGRKERLTVEISNVAAMGREKVSPRIPQRTLNI